MTKLKYYIDYYVFVCVWGNFFFMISRNTKNYDLCIKRYYIDLLLFFFFFLFIDVYINCKLLEISNFGLNCFL